VIPLSILVLALVQTPATPPPAPADGLVAGRVIDGTTGRPVAGVTVTLAPRATPNTPPPPRDSTPPPPRVLVDSAGRFVFTGLKPGSYDVTAARRGFVSGELGKLRPDGLRMALVLGPSERRTDLTLRVWRHASIAGAVLDDNNEPVVGIEVHALRREWVAGDVRLVRSSGATTDDRGRYRIGSLLPGDYLIVVPSTQNTFTTAALIGSAANPANSLDARRAQPPGSRDNQRVGDFVIQESIRSLVQPAPGVDGRVIVYPATYYPGTPDVLNGALVGLATGEPKSIPPIRMRPVPAVRVSGVLTGPDGPAASVSLVLVPQIADAFASEYGFEAASTMTDAAGAFTFLGVTPGTFRLRASTQPAAPMPATSGGGAMSSSPAGPSYWLMETISVSGRDVTVAFTLKSTFRVSGQLVFDGTKPRPRADQMRDVVAFAAADGRQINRLRGRDLGSQDGRFEIQGVSGGRYVLAPWSVPPGWFVKSVSVRGQDAVDAPWIWTTTFRTSS
jgi:hypothetical protein